MPKLTVFTTDGGTESDNGNSFAGHMFYVLTDDNGTEHSFGFAPDSSHVGTPFAPGSVYHDDLNNYWPLLNSSESVTISQADYNTLYGFGTEGSPNFMKGFDSYCNVVNNSCIDFTWAALQQIGIQMPTHVPGNPPKLRSLSSFSESYSCVVFVRGFAASNGFHDADRSARRSNQVACAAFLPPSFRSWCQAEERAGAA